MEDIIFGIIVSFVVSLVLTAVLVFVYNIVIGIPRGIKIKKEKKYKTVTATRIVFGSQYSMDKLNETGRRYVFKYEWSVDGKTYRRRINTSVWPAAVDTFYYLNDPKYAMPLPEELARFRHTKGLFTIIFVIVFLFTFGK